MKTHLYRYGDRVLIGPESERIEGAVTACSVRGPEYGAVMYCVSWWDGRTHREEWFPSVLVEAGDEQASRAVLVWDGVTIEGCK